MTELNPVQRLSRDLAVAALTLSDQEARYLVDSYYIMQESRKRYNNQITAIKNGTKDKQTKEWIHEPSEPHEILHWLARESETLEKQVKRALDKYTQGHPMGEWMRSIHGIGPVISAGILAHIDITKVPTAGHIWSFAGLVPGVTWEKGKKRPWNAQLKTILWHAGQCFMKFNQHPDCFYGHIYAQRKQFEVERNERGDNKELALQQASRYDKKTDAYKHCTGGKLPPAHLDARARRYAVKLFVAHLQQVWYETHYGKPAPNPYPIEHLGHVHKVEPPNYTRKA